MPKQYNKLTFAGHLGGDPVVRYTPGGQPVTSFNVASNDQYKNEDGEIVQVTTWFRCTVWGKVAEFCGQYLHKGSQVLVEGKLTPDKRSGRPRIWTRQDGSPAADYEVNVREIYFLDGRNEAGAQAEAADPEDDIPF